MRLPTSAKDIFVLRNWKIRLLQFTNHVMSFLGLYFFWHLDLFTFSILVYFFMFCFGVNIGVHRYFSHKSFKANKLVEYFLALCFTLSTIGSTLSWVGMHRVHHRNSDQEGDPHTPLGHGLKGFLWAYFGIWRPYTAKISDIGDLRRNSLHRKLHNYYFLIIFSYIILLAFIDFKLVFYGYFLPATMSFHGASLIVTLGHVHGEQHFKTNDSSRNSFIVHWLTWGEGLHNLHHRFPKKYHYNSSSLPWYFFDLPGWIIGFLKKKNNRGQVTGTVEIKEVDAKY